MQHSCALLFLFAAEQREFKKMPITAVTATATADVQADIIKTLGITRSAVVHKVGR
jgi:superfamily II DNA helicase RecQ